jgi:hypothetical protein
LLPLPSPLLLLLPRPLQPPWPLAYLSSPLCYCLNQAKEVLSMLAVMLVMLMAMLMVLEAVVLMATRESKTKKGTIEIDEHQRFE